jgi:hypothetical protein
MSAAIDPKNNSETDEIRKIKAFLIIAEKYRNILTNLRNSKLPDYENILQQYIRDETVRNTLLKELAAIKLSLDEIQNSEAYKTLMAHIEKTSAPVLLSGEELTRLNTQLKDSFGKFSADFAKMDSKWETTARNIRAKVGEYKPTAPKPESIAQTATSTSTASATRPAVPDRMPDPAWLKDREKIEAMKERLKAQGKKEMLEMLNDNLFNWDFSKSDETREKAKNNLYYLARLPGVGWMEPKGFDYSIITETQFRTKLQSAIKALKDSGLEGIDDIAQPIIEQYSLFLSQFVENGLDKRIPGKVNPANVNPMPAFCIDGPPGTGKTSISQAIAKALDIGYFYEPMASKSEKEIIFGHGSSWVSPDPGLISRAMIDTGRTDYLLLADEVEKAELSLLNTLGEILEVNQRTYKDDFFKSGINKGHPLIVLTTNDFTKLPEFVQSRVTKLYMGGYPDEIKIKILKGSLLNVRTPSNISFVTADKNDLKDIQRDEYDLFTIELVKKPTIADLARYEEARQVPLLIKYKGDDGEARYLIYGTNKDLTDIPDQNSKPFLSLKFQQDTLTPLESHAVVPAVYKTLKNVKGYTPPIIPAARIFSYEANNTPSDDVVRFLIENYVVVPGVREAKALLQALVAKATFEARIHNINPLRIDIAFVKEKFGESPVKEIKDLEKSITQSNLNLSKLRNEILDLVSLQENLGELGKLDEKQITNLKTKVAQYVESKKELILLENRIQKALRESKPSLLEPINKQVDILRENHKGAIDKIRAMDLELITKANAILAKEQLKAEALQQTAATMTVAKPVTPTPSPSVTFRQTAAPQADDSSLPPSATLLQSLQAAQMARSAMSTTGTATSATLMTPGAVAQRSIHPALSVNTPASAAHSMTRSLPAISVDASPPSPRATTHTKPIPEITKKEDTVLHYLQKGAVSLQGPPPQPKLIFDHHSWDALTRKTMDKYNASSTHTDLQVREVFHDWHIDLSSGNSKSSFDLKRGEQIVATIARDPHTGPIVKTVNIISNNSEPAPDAILQMVVNACQTAREAGKDFITISGCQDTPKTALLMENLIELAGFKAKYSPNDSTKVEVEKIRGSYKLETDPILSQSWFNYKNALQQEIFQRPGLDL